MYFSFIKIIIIMCKTEYVYVCLSIIQFNHPICVTSFTQIFYKHLWIFYTFYGSWNRCRLTSVGKNVYKSTIVIWSNFDQFKRKNHNIESIFYQWWHGFDSSFFLIFQKNIYILFYCSKWISFIVLFWQNQF